MAHKILYITNGISGPGGLERVLSIKASYLADHLNYKVFILTLNQNTECLFYHFSDKIKYHNIQATGNPVKYILQYRSGIKNYIKKIMPDIVLVCDDGLKGLLLPIIIGKPCPMIYERHVSKNIEVKSERPSIINKLKTWATFKLMDFGAARYNKFIVLTQGNTNEWHLHNVQVIPNPLSFYPKHEEISTLTNKNVLAVGKQSYQKGYDRLLQSWKLVHEKHPDWTLDIYGTFSESENLEALGKKLNILKSVNFYEPVKNISEKYKEASIYVMSSRYEGFGMVLTEAMSYGVPCVSFDCPYGPSDIIAHDEDGYLVKNGDTITLAERINKLIENSTLRINMGQTARRNVERFLPEVIVPQWDELFKKMLIN